MENQLTIPYLEEIKAHFGLTDFDEELGGLPINGHFVFIYPVANLNQPVLMLSASVCENTSQEDTDKKLEFARRLQIKEMQERGYALALEPDEQFFVLEKLIFPDDASAACAAIEEFTAEATLAEDSFASPMTTSLEN